MQWDSPMDAWDEFEWNKSRPSYDGIWFLCVPAEPPFPCTPREAEVWLSLELQMWEYYVLASVSDEVNPLFLDEPGRDDEETRGLRGRTRGPPRRAGSRR